jgi:hypothetical protein
MTPQNKRPYGDGQHHEQAHHVVRLRCHLTMSRTICHWRVVTRRPPVRPNDQVYAGRTLSEAPTGRCAHPRELHPIDSEPCVGLSRLPPRRGPACVLGNPLWHTCPRRVPSTKNRPRCTRHGSLFSAHGMGHLSSQGLMQI